MIVREDTQIGGLMSAPLVLADIHFSRDLYQQISQQHRYDDSNLRNFNIICSYCLEDLVGFRVDKPGVRGGIWPIREFFESRREDFSKIAMLCAHGTNYQPGWNYWDGEENISHLVNEWVSTMDDPKKYSALLLYCCNPDNFSLADARTPLIYPDSNTGGIFSDYSVRIKLPKPTVVNRVTRFLERLVA